jgi:L-fucose isomerase-like protein
VKVARLYLGKPDAHWPTPRLDLSAERRGYEADFAKMRDAFADIEFPVDELVADKKQVEGLQERLKSVDGVLLIHLSMGMLETIEAILACGRPTALFAAPYSGHEWAQFGALRQKPAGARLECFLTSDRAQLAAAVRPFRAIHHLREARILNVISRAPDEAKMAAWRAKFGTEFKTVGLERMLAAYEAVSVADAAAEARRWIRQAAKVVEPSRDEIVRSCRLALAFENLLAEEDATVITVDCYGSMYRKLPAFPCVGFVRLNDLGLGGICESDLTSAMTYIILQGLSGRPGFVSDPTVDEAADSIILAHCLGTRKMDGPGGKAAPYRLRTIMERQEGCVPQVFMRRGQKVTQAWLATPETLLYFTGDIIAVPDSDRGCRTQIKVRVDGDIAKVWQNWAHGLHRLTCYGDLTDDLRRFCRYVDLKFVNEA